jgi:hypothetical protein
MFCTGVRSWLTLLLLFLGGAATAEQPEGPNDLVYGLGVPSFSASSQAAGQWPCATSLPAGLMPRGVGTVSERWSYRFGHYHTPERRVGPIYRPGSFTLGRRQPLHRSSG